LASGVVKKLKKEGATDPTSNDNPGAKNQTTKRLHRVKQKRMRKYRTKTLQN